MKLPAGYKVEKSATMKKAYVVGAKNNDVHQMIVEFGGKADVTSAKNRWIIPFDKADEITIDVELAATTTANVLPKTSNRKAKEWDSLYNEGYTDGYNPYRNNY